MEPDDPVRAVRLKELYALTELSKSVKTEGSKIIHERLDALPDELVRK